MNSRYPVVQRHLRNILIVCSVAVVAWLSPVDTNGQVTDSTLVTRFQLAESFIRAAQFQRAIGLLEDLVARSPETHVFYERLRSAYENVKRFDDAIALVDSRIRRETVPTLYIAEKARLLFLKGEEDLAEEFWQQAIETNPSSAGVYLLVYRSTMQVRMFELAIDFLEQGRERLHDETLFQTDLAYLYGLSSQHEKAMREYLSLLRSTNEQFNFVRLRLNQFVSDEGVLETSIAETENAVAASPLVRSFREILAWLYIEAGRFREAFSVSRAIDQLENEQGRVLFAFAQVAAEAGAYGVATEAYNDILERYPNAPIAPEALRGLGLTQERWAASEGVQVYNESGTSIPGTRYHEALASYSRFLREYKNHVYFPDVLRRVGRLQQDVFFKYEEAEQILMEVVSRFPQDRAADDAAFDIARLMLVKDDLISAEVQFSRLVSRLRTGEIADIARYELAMLHFYKGEFESALSLASALQENTSSDIANDAIQLKLLLMENRGPDSLDTPLTRFARALLLKRQRHSDEALSSIELLLDQIGEHALSDDLRFERANLLRDNGQTSEALQAYLEIPLMQPESFLGAKSLFEAADIQATELADPTAAIATYSRLLSEFPGSLLVPESRVRIRRLRGDGV